MSNIKSIYWIGNDLDENNKNKEKIKGYDNFEECDDVINAMNKIKIPLIIIILYIYICFNKESIVIYLKIL